MTDLFDDFNYEVVEDKVLSKKVHADTDIRTGHIRIKESVYEGACNGEGRDRMTIGPNARSNTGKWVSFYPKKVR